MANFRPTFSSSPSSHGVVKMETPEDLLHRTSSSSCSSSREDCCKGEQSTEGDGDDDDDVLRVTTTSSVERRERLADTSNETVVHGCTSTVVLPPKTLGLPSEPSPSLPSCPTSTKVLCQRSISKNESRYQLTHGRTDIPTILFLQGVWRRP